MIAQTRSQLLTFLASPGDLLGRVRWLFLICSLLSAALLLPMLIVMHDLSWHLRAGAAVALGWLAWLWIHRYQQVSFPLHWEIAEAMALLVVGMAYGYPTSNGLLFVGLYFRSLYGTGHQAFTGILAYLGAHAVSVGASPLSSASIDQPQVLIQAVAFVVVGTVMHMLVVTLTRHERASARQQALREAGVALVSARGREEIYDAAVSACRMLLRVTPAQISVWTASGDQLTLVASSADQLRRLTAAGDPDEPAARTISRAAFDAEHANRPSVVVPLRGQGADRGVICVVSEQPLSIDDTDALSMLGNQVLLALESAIQAEDLHRQQNEDRFRSLVQNSSDVITVVSADTTIKYQSPSVERVLGYSASELAGTKLSSLLHPEDLVRTRTFFTEIAAHASATAPAEWRLRHRDGTWRYVEVVANNLLTDPNVGGAVLNIREIGDRKALEEQLAHQAFHDPLTNLANRVLLRHRVEYALARSSRHGLPVAVLFIDLDGFKTINDSLGHAAGDQLLLGVARRIQACLRTNDTAARLGGDEFAILLEADDPSQPLNPTHVAEQILQSLSSPFQIQGKEVFVTASIGVAVSEPGQEEGQAGVEELLRNADVAMYMAKSRGKSRYELFEPSMHAAVVERLELEAGLQRAMERDEFVLHYQPLFSLQTGRVVGVEALVRWAHAERGMISPSIFIPVAEETGMILPLGDWVLRESCRQARNWQREFPSDPPLRMSVNLSARQLQQPDLVEDVARALFESRLDPGSLTLEITESIMLQDTEATIEKLHQLKTLGVRLAIDDFGTGYSSLSYLQRLPIDVLKVDKAFVRNIATAAEASALTRAIIHLGHSLQLKTLAEGIEEAAQLECLQDLGCDLGQGFLFSRPLPAEGLTDLLQTIGLRDQWPARGPLARGSVVARSA